MCVDKREIGSISHRYSMGYQDSLIYLLAWSKFGRVDETFDMGIEPTCLISTADETRKPNPKTVTELFPIRPDPNFGSCRQRGSVCV